MIEINYRCTNKECETLIGITGSCTDDVTTCPECGSLSNPESTNKPLLQIELKDINSVPTVFYKGEEINGKIKIKFDYVTNTGRLDPTFILIKHQDPDTKDNNVRTIKHNEPLEVGGEE